MKEYEETMETTGDYGDMWVYISLNPINNVTTYKDELLYLESMAQGMEAGNYFVRDCIPTFRV